MFSRTFEVTVNPVDDLPTAIAMQNAVTSLAEDTDTTSATKMGDIVITDADGGTNAVVLSGTDAASFEVVGSELFLKAGVALDYETKTSYAVTLTTGSVSVDHTLSITDVDESPSKSEERTCSSLKFRKKTSGLSPVVFLIAVERTVLLLNKFVVKSLRLKGFC